MIQYKTLNVKLSNSQLNKLKSRIKNGTEVTLKIKSNVVGDSNGENNFPHKLLLTNPQLSKLPKIFADNSSASMKLSKTQLHKIGLHKTGLPLMKNVLKPLAESALSH